MNECGIDLVEVKRFEAMLSRADDPQLRTLFTPAELEHCRAKARPAESLAARFAAKEAVLKIFPDANALKDLDFPDIEIEIDGYGAPQLKPGDRLAACMKKARIARIAISLSHAGGFACAVAVAR